MADKYLNNVRFNANIYKADSFESIVSPEATSTSAENINVANALGTMARWYDEINSLKMQADYSNYILSGMMVARVVDYDNCEQSLLLGDFNRLNCFKNRRRCNVRNDGTIVAWYGDNNYVDDVSDISQMANKVDVMVYQPKFFYRVEPLLVQKTTNGSVAIRKAIYYISDVAMPGFKLHPAFINHLGNDVNYFLMGAFESCLHTSSNNYIGYMGSSYNNMNLDTDEFVSVGGVIPFCYGYTTSSQLIDGDDYYRLISKNKNTNGNIRWQLMGISQYNANQLMMLIEYGPNPKSVLGRGIVDVTSYGYPSLTGSTSSLGNDSGAATSTAGFNDNTVDIGINTYIYYVDDGKVAISYRGMENPYGNTWEYVHDCALYTIQGTWNGGTCEGGIVHIYDVAYSADGTPTYTDMPLDGCGWTAPHVSSVDVVNRFGHTDKHDWLLIATTAKGNGENTVIDGSYQTRDPSSSDGLRNIVIGGGSSDGDTAGLFATKYDKLTPSTEWYGCRLCWMET